MLKLNSTGGKFDITITDDALFGPSRKPPTKQVAQRGTRATSRAANPQGRPQNKKTAVRPSEKPIKDKNGRDAKPPRKVPLSNQNKPSSSKGKHLPSKQLDERKVLSKGGTSQGTGVITQAKLDSILSMLNNSQTSSGATTSLSPEQVSALVTTFSKINTTEQHQAVPSDLPVQDSHGADSKSANSGGNHQISRNDITAKVENNKQANYRKQLEEQVASKRKAKELQKQKELFEEYNPWGRPGAGAPIRSQSGNVIADYHSRTVKESVDTAPQESVTTAIKQSQTMPSQTHPAPVATVASSTSNVDTTLPVALRSSFAVGAPGLVANETQQKRQQEMRWKQELEQQIEEKKERDRQRKWKEEQEDLLNLSWNNKHSRQPQKDTKPSHVTNNLQATIEQQKPVVPQETHVEVPNLPLNQSLDESFKRTTHARGFGMHTMDPQSLDEAEKKRLKMLEHQRAIQEQVEENRRKKQQEREQRLKEEAIEEARLAKEREKLNQAFEIERKRKIEKEEEAKRVSEALQQSVLDAYESAQQAKREKRQKHLEAGHTKRGGGTSSRSYVISQASSQGHHSIHDNTVTQSPGRQSIASNYTTPRPTERNTLRNKSRASRTVQAEPPVPPLNLVRVVSPPVPTLRNKLPQNMQPTSYRSVTPTSGKGSHLQRTVSTNSEPPVRGSMVLSAHQEIAHRNELENILQSDLPTARYKPDDNPIDTLEDAFMVPYHRTDSATLPAPGDTNEDSVPQEQTVKPKGNNIHKKNTTKKAQVNTLTPMYRSQSTHFKTAKTETQGSPRKTKGNAGPKGAKPAGQPGLSPRGAVKKSLKGNQSTVFQPKSTKYTADDGKTKKMSPRIEAALSRLSGRQEAHEGLATARQEMILQQLAALRQGLILKEQELKQELHP